ncbi:MAG: 16S rRNA (adenine(1518)-N(6)/adenine(1519)-N(6))-dimethyltransferase RsmA [Oscillospiraceae bacterium]|nr:16S rRNA (adenine(1518)-N(6)/adenine(1519)-N(6))-dimethyltransferase RsmA [Oscillospiraceae bacterium]
MNLCNIDEIRALLARHGFRFSKSKGQNFLIARWVPEEICAHTGMDRQCGVLEIGPGIGPLTDQLCRHAGKVVAIEVDQALRPVLAETMEAHDNLELLFGDALKMDLRALAQEKFSGLHPVACANLPYYITTPILTALLESRAFESVTVMVQKEAAERICAGAGSENYGVFALLCRYYADPKILFAVSPDCFLPQPKVTSAVIRLQTRPAPPEPVGSETVFFRTVHASFAQRRKMLQNGLSAAYGEFSKEEIADIITSCGFSPTIRGEKLDFAGFAALSRELTARLDARKSV